MDNQIQSLCKRLKLPGIFATYESVTREAIEKKITYPEYLIQILKAEEESRDEKGKQKRILSARFPTIKSFEQIELDCQYFRFQLILNDLQYNIIYYLIFFLN